MDGGEIILTGFAVIFVLLILKMIFRKEDKEYTTYKEKLGKSLEDEYIIDQDTGAKLTLEQAQSGNWNLEEVPYYSEEDVAMHYSEDFQNMYTAKYYLEKREVYESIELEYTILEFLITNHIFAKYDSCSFTASFINKASQTKILFSWVEIQRLEYSEIQLLFWVTISNFNGHYYLSEKNKSEQIAIKLTNKNALFFNDYYCEILKASFSNGYELGILEKCAAEKRIEVEIFNNNLFIKTTDLASIKNINRIEQLIETLPL